MKNRRPKLFSIEAYDTVTTTMDTEPPLLPGATIARQQTRGRGRTGPWQSPPGGAWLTLHTPQPPPPGLPVAVGGCTAAKLNQLLGRQAVAVKWPNDLIAAPCGPKLGGILVEHRGTATRIGIGINVHNNPPPGATSLSQLGYRKGLAQVIQAAIEAALEALANTATCIEAARRLDALKTATVEVETPTGTLRGTAEGIASDAALTIRDTHGRLHRVTCCHVKTYHCVLPSPRR